MFILDSREIEIHINRRVELRPDRWYICDRRTCANARLSTSMADDSDYPKAWLEEVFRRHYITGPDRRPLYAYRIAAREFEQLGTLLQGVPVRTVEHCALFCIYIAEWWRRWYDGGVWSWSEPLRALGVGDGYSKLYGPTQRGLQYWGRPLRSHHGTRQFLVTLCCEGGLPLGLLASDDHSVKRFFSRLLDEQARGELPRDALPAVAAHLAQSLLSSRLRNDQVYELATDLVAAVVALRPKIPESGDILAVLDRSDPEWRHRMPLDLEDPIAVRLFHGLARQVVAQPPRSGGSLRVSTELHLAGGAWRLTRRIDLPRHMPAAGLSALLGEDVPAQLQLYVVIDAGIPVPLALASQFATNSSQGPRYLLERLTRSTGFDATDTVELLGISGARTLGPRPLPNGSPLSALPWVFTPATDPDEQGMPAFWRLHGQGSARVRGEMLLVAVAVEHSWRSEPNDATQRIGEMSTPTGLHAILRLVGGSLVVSTPAGDCSIHTRATEETVHHYTLVGERLPILGRERPVFLGVPGVELHNAEGLRQRMHPRDLEWRSVGSRAPWAALSAQAAGDIEVRHVARGELRWSANLRVLPAATRIEIEPSPRRGEGRVTLRGVGELHASLKGPTNVTIVAHPEGDGVRAWDCRAEGPVVEPLDLTLVLRDGLTLGVKVLFPGIDACFVDVFGHRLEQGERVFIGHLGGLTARVTGNGEVLGAARLEAHLVAGARQSLSDFSFTLRPTGFTGGHAEIHLGPLLRWSRLALASTTELDAAIRLTLHDGARGTTAISLHRYDITLEPDADAGEVRLRTGTLLAPEVLSRLRIECFPLKEPTQEPTLLDRLESGRWRFLDGQRAAGSWLVVARDGGWCRSRPLCFFVKADAPEPEEVDEAALGGAAVSQSGAPLDLVSIVDLRSMDERSASYRELLGRIQEHPDHADWEPLLDYTRTLGDLPAATFEVIRILSEFPGLSARAAIDVGMRSPDSFAALWEGMEELPFFWWLVPFEAWRSAASLRAEQLRQGLISVGMERDQVEAHVRTNLGRVFKLLARRSPGFEILANGVSDAIFGPEIRQNDPLALIGSPAGEQYLLGILSDDAQSLLRRHTVDRWPPGSHLRLAAEELRPRVPMWDRLVRALPQAAGHCRPALLAPLVAACICGFGEKSSPPLATELRGLQAFDPEWFDQSHANALALIIANRSRVS